VVSGYERGTVERAEIRPGVDENHLSARVARGTWCYAATAQAIIQALTGQLVAQEQIAHEFYLYISTNGLYDKDRSDWKAIQAYGEKVKQLQDTFEVGSSYAEIKVYLEQADQTLLRKSYGQLGLDRPGLKVATGKKPDLKQVCAAIDGKGLVAFGTAMHWLVVYGYAVQPDGQVNLLVWDPTNGKGKTYQPTDIDDLLASLLYYVVYPA
jgi:hypothetical protein